MLKNPFRRRPVAPTDLPPVSSASTPGPLHSGLTGDAFTAAAALDGAAVLSSVATAAAVKAEPVPTSAEPEPVTVSWPEREPRRVEQPLGGLAPLGVAAPLWRPGTYTIRYDRVGDLGRRGGLPAPMPLTCPAMSAGDLAQHIADDVAELTGLRVSAVVDQAAGGGHLLGAGGMRVGSFIYEHRGRIA